MSATFTLSPEVLESMLSEIKSIDEQLVKASGTVAERRKAAEAALRLQEATTETVGPFTILDSALTELENVKSLVDEAENDVKEAVNGYLRSQKDETSAEAEALKVARAALVTKAAAVAALLEVQVDVPKAPRGSGSSNGSGKRVSTSKGTFSYRRSDSDQWTVPCDDQQALSSIAYRVFNHAPVAALRSALEGIDQTKSWEQTVTVNGQTATIKFDVVPVEDAPSS